MCFLFLYIFLFGCKFEIWRKKTRFILFQVGFFFNIYKFYFFLFSTLYLVSSFLETVRNPRSSSEEEEEEIEIPKSRNSSRTLRTWAAAARRRINPSRHQTGRTFHPSP
jgi:hypothetical protein